MALAHSPLRLGGGESPELAGRLHARAVRVHQQHTEGSSQAPRITIASFPVSLPAIAKWLEASASFSMPVSGDFDTTANFALVVSGVPTNGEKTNASGASGASGSTRGGASLCMSQVASPAPPMQRRSTVSGSGSGSAPPSPTSTIRARPKYPPGGISAPASAARNASASPAASVAPDRG